MLRPYQIRALKIVQIKYPMATREELPQRYLSSESKVLNFIYAVYLYSFFGMFALISHILIEIPVLIIGGIYVLGHRIKNPKVEFVVDGVDLDGRPTEFYHPPFIFLELKAIELKTKCFPFMYQKIKHPNRDQNQGQ